MKLPATLQALLGDSSFVLDEIGKSGAQIACFDTVVLKIEPQGEEAYREHAMLAWLSGKIPVPTLQYFEQVEGMQYLLMGKLAGQMLCADTYLQQPAALVRLLAAGLTMLWGVDIAHCPYDASLDTKLLLAQERVASNLCSMDDVEPDTYGENGFQSPSHLLAWLKANKPAETLVLSHGDYCLPNVFAKNGAISGFLDWGRGGMADAYQDIALCYRSLENNFGGRFTGKAHPGFHPNLLFDALGIVPDWAKIRYYILLDELF